MNPDTAAPCNLWKFNNISNLYILAFCTCCICPLCMCICIHLMKPNNTELWSVYGVPDNRLKGITAVCSRLLLVCFRTECVSELGQRLAACPLLIMLELAMWGSSEHLPPSDFGEISMHVCVVVVVGWREGGETGGGERVFAGWECVCGYSHTLSAVPLHLSLSVSLSCWVDCAACLCYLSSYLCWLPNTCWLKTSSPVSSNHPAIHGSNPRAQNTEWVSPSLCSSFSSTLITHIYSCYSGYEWSLFAWSVNICKWNF